MALAPVLGHDLAGLRRHAHDQAAYARHALAIAACGRQAIHEARATAKTTTRSRRSTTTRTDAQTSSASGWTSTATPTTASPPAGSGRSRVLDEAGDGYRVFTTAYDREAEGRDAGARRAAEGIPRATRSPHRRPGPQRRAAGARSCKAAACRARARRLGRRRRKKAASTAGGWRNSSPRRPSGACSASSAANRWPTASVGFLIDCSGSMKQHVESVAMLVDVFARALEQAGVAQRGARLHHRRVERRPRAARLAARRPARASGPAQRGVPHGLQGRRHALAPRAARHRRAAEGRPVPRRHRRRGGRLGLRAPAWPAARDGACCS